jgi:hypothetical protein
MGVHSGPVVYDGTSAKNVLSSNQYVALRSSQNGTVSVPKVWADVTSDSTTGWFLTFMAYPRVTSPYNASAVGSDSPHPNDAGMTKLSDTSIQTILNQGAKTTRTQWFHTSEADGSVWADGSLNNSSTMYNIFENPSQWNSVSSSSGQRFKRRQGPTGSYTDWITSGSTSGCAGPAGGWSNYYEQSCTISWFASCEGAPAYYHCCACPVDRASKLIVWAN